ncbi:MAG: sulfite exporter TauE/SafE family protein [Chloroflexota bacterium]|nr:sulfite exporter TauE/SafE family protein [Chloroflexota bacterium]
MDVSQFIGVMLAAMFAATFGSMLGLGGGVFLVPLLTLFFDIDPRIAVGASAVCVVTNSVVGSSVHIRSGFTNLRLSMLLQVTTAVGAIIGALIALRVDASAISFVLGLVLLYSAASMLRQRRVNPEPPPADAPDPFGLRTSYLDPATKHTVTYLPSRIKPGLAISGGAGVLSGMLGIGGGAIQVPLMNLMMKVPVKAAAGTSSFMVGMTAVATAAVFYSHGEIDPTVVVPAMIGIFAGAKLGSQITRRVQTQRLILVFVIVIAYLGVSMVLEAFDIGLT